jgi:hypothetical protein
MKSRQTWLPRRRSSLANGKIPKIISAPELSTNMITWNDEGNGTHYNSITAENRPEDKKTQQFVFKTESIYAHKNLPSSMTSCSISLWKHQDHR